MSYKVQTELDFWVLRGLEAARHPSPQPGLSQHQGAQRSFSRPRAYQQFVRTFSDRPPKAMQEFLEELEDSLQGQSAARGVLFRHFIFEKYFFVLFCKLFGVPNEALGVRYRPLFAENALQCATCPGLINYLREFILRTSGRPMLPKGGHGWSEQGSVVSLGDQLSALSQDATNWPRKQLQRKVAAVWSGPPGNGKRATLRCLLQTLETQVEVISPLTIRSLKEVAVKFAKSVISQDVVASLKSANNLTENFADSLSLYRSISRDSCRSAQRHNSFQFGEDSLFSLSKPSPKPSLLFFEESEPGPSDLPNTKGLRVFIVENVHNLLAEESPKNAKTKLQQFLKFVRSSRHPFIFVHDSSADTLFTSFEPTLLSFHAPLPDPLELAALFFLIWAVEDRFRALPALTYEDELIPLEQLVEQRLVAAESVAVKRPAPCLHRILYLLHRFDFNLHRMFGYLDSNPLYLQFSPLKFTFADDWDGYFRCPEGRWWFDSERVVALTQKRYPKHLLRNQASSTKETETQTSKNVTAIDLQLEHEDSLGIQGSIWESGRHFSWFPDIQIPNTSHSDPNQAKVDLERLSHRLQCLAIRDRIETTGQSTTNPGRDWEQSMWAVSGLFQQSVSLRRKKIASTFRIDGAGPAEIDLCLRLNEAISSEARDRRPTQWRRPERTEDTARLLGQVLAEGWGADWLRQCASN